MMMMMIMQTLVMGIYRNY